MTLFCFIILENRGWGRLGRAGQGVNSPLSSLVPNLEYCFQYFLYSEMSFYSITLACLSLLSVYSNVFMQQRKVVFFSPILPSQSKQERERGGLKVEKGFFSPHMRRHANFSGALCHAK